MAAIMRHQDYKGLGDKRVGTLRVAWACDIDGCVDPGMLKHEDGFGTAAVQHYGMQQVTEVAKRAWMFVNCYSETRGVNRFMALYTWADLLREQTPSVSAAGVSVPEFKYLRRWEEQSKVKKHGAIYEFLAGGAVYGILDNRDSQEEFQQATAELVKAAHWSELVDRMVPATIENVRAFPQAVAAIRRAHEMGVAIYAVSGTPEDYVAGQLAKYGVLDCFDGLLCKEAGKKGESIATLVAGPFADSDPTPLLKSRQPLVDVIWMMGDAWKDYKEAQRANTVLTGAADKPARMYFIQVGSEPGSWEEFGSEVLEQLVADRWSAEAEAKGIQAARENLSRIWTPDITTIDTFPHSPG